MGFWRICAKLSVYGVSLPRGAVGWFAVCDLALPGAFETGFAEHVYLLGYRDKLESYYWR